MDISIIMKLLELFVLLFIGYIVIALKVIKKEANKHFSSLIFYVAVPALVINSMAGGTEVPNEDVFIVVVTSIVFYLFLIAASLMLPKLFRVDENYIGLYRFMVLFGNVGFIGFPVINMLLGSEAVFYAVLFNIPYNILVYTLGVIYISRDTENSVKVSIKHILNPGLVATLFGLVLFFAKIQLPKFLDSLTESVGNMTTPLSLIVIGGSLYGVKVKTVLKKPLIFVFSLIKLLIIPTLVAFTLKLVGVEGIIAIVPVVISGMPLAANTVILSQEYDGHVLEASEAVFISTLLMMATLPYVLFLIEQLFGKI